MKLMTQFLFLHPTHKRLVEFVSETVFLGFIKFYRQNDLKKQLNEITNAFYLLETEKDSDLIETENKLLNTAKVYSKKFSNDCLTIGRE